MTLTVQELVEEQAIGIVGREHERAILLQLCGEGGPLVVFVHGIGGVGKSAIVGAFAVEARARGATVLLLDCGEIEPTEHGFLTALSDAVGGELLSPADAAARLGGLGGRVVLALDRYEVLRPLDPWLRQAFVPALGDGVRVVLAGREPPITGWRNTFGGLFRSLPIANLSRENAAELLRQAGITGSDAESINRLARGHPLSLRLASAALLEYPGVDRDATTVNAIVKALTELYLARLDPATRKALDAASVVRRPTISLLAAMLPEAAPQDTFDRLRCLPFVELSNDGLVLHDTVREVVAAFLRSSDPDRSRRYRIAAWRQLRDEVARASQHEMWRYTADLLFILENPLLREAFFPTTEHLYFVEAARPADGPSIDAIIRRNEPAASGAILGEWWQRAPYAFRVTRDATDAVVGFYIVAPVDRLPHTMLEADPVARQWLNHLRQHPVSRGQRVLFERIERANDDDPAQSSVYAAILLDLKRIYMEMRPDLRRIYTVDREPVTPGSVWSRVGLEQLPADPPNLGGIVYYPAVLDFGPASVDGWLTRIIATELQIEDESILDVVQRQLVLEGRRVDLTKLEFDVLSYLSQRPGKVVERTALLRDVWGYDYSGGSNVVEVLMASIRRKLGSRAGAIQTVRGRGYRFVDIS